MDDFRNRMMAQRHILAIVNKSFRAREELCGLSENAIARWSEVNGVPSASQTLQLLRKAADLLFFLATKSQEQVTDEYELRMQDVATVTAALRLCCNEAAGKLHENEGG